MPVGHDEGEAGRDRVGDERHHKRRQAHEGHEKTVDAAEHDAHQQAEDRAEHRIVAAIHREAGDHAGQRENQPTERSMPPVITTNSTPTAMMISGAADCATLAMLP